MVLYQYLKGRQSPAVWCEEAKLNEAMQWLGRGYEPGRRTWYEFRDRIGPAVEQLHEHSFKMQWHKVTLIRLSAFKTERSLLRVRPVIGWLLQSSYASVSSFWPA